MPSAEVKVDKPVSSENAIADSSPNNNPLKQAITIIEHKIRNLEKRKSKLESYKELQNAGKELNSDQKTAVAKFGEVTQTLEFAKDLSKQFVGILAYYEKEAKKQARKEAAAKNQAELARLREILLVQDALNQMGTDSVRDDFLHGRNGAAQLTEADLKLLDDVYPAVTPKHEAGNPTAFTNDVQAAAEHLLAVVDGKPKEIFGGSYSQVKEILGKIHESGYFDQAQVQEEVYVESYVESEVQDIPLGEPVLNNEPVIPPEPVQALPPIESLTVEPLPPIQPQPSIEQPPPVEQPIPPEQQQMYYQQPPRPITEMLGTGSFFFLQESEIDTPEQIPSQTFTNQNFVPSAQPQVQMKQHYQNIPSNLPPSMPSAGNNGIDEPQKLSPPSKDQQHKSNSDNRPPRTSNTNASYYQNNNGYNNRPRQRNGTRPNNNARHN